MISPDWSGKLHCCEGCLLASYVQQQGGAQTFGKSQQDTPGLGHGRSRSGLTEVGRRKRREEPILTPSAEA